MTIFDFEKHVPPAIYSRGYNYWLEGRVMLLRRIGDAYNFSVEGTSTYCVDIELDKAGKVLSYECDCPYDGPMCKHVVACLVYINETRRQDYESQSDALDNFTDEELSLLYYCSYTGHCIPSDFRWVKEIILPMDDGRWRLTADKHKQIADRLFGYGWLKEAYMPGLPGYGSNAYVIPYDKALRVLMYMYRTHPSWEQYIISRERGNLPNVILALIAKYLEVGEVDFGPLKDERLEYIPDDFRFALEEALDEDIAGELPSLLPEWLVISLIENELALTRRDGDTEALELAHDILMSVPSPGLSFTAVHAQLRMLWFYVKGELLEAMPDEAMFDSYHFVTGTALLFQGKAEEAIQEYRIAIPLQETPKGFAKDIPHDPWNMYLYICALGIRNNEADMAFLKAIPTKIKRSSLSGYDCFNLLAYTISGQRQNERLYTYSINSERPMQRILSRIICAYSFGKDYFRKYGPSWAPGQFYASLGLALLDNEMEAVSGISSPGALWGYEALITRVRKHEPWESDISDLIAMLASSRAGKPSEERVIYYVPPHSERVEVRLQGKLKSGAYSRGKVVSAARYSACDFPMDEVDKAIHGAWLKSGNYYTPSLAEVIPHCVGTDKLFTDIEWRTFSPVTVVEEKPYLATSRGDGRISFVSNVPSDVLRNNSDNVFYQWSSDRKKITYWSLGAAEVRVLKTLLDLKSVPAEAEALLENLFAPLQGRLEVQSDVKGGVQLERKVGSTVLCARLRRENNYYMVTFLAHPLEGGSVYVKPGTGNEVILDENADGRYEVTRDLKKEKKVLKKAMEILDCSRAEDCLVLPSTLLYALENPSAFKDVFFMEWPKGQELRLKEAAPADFHVTATGKGGWFELEGDLKVSEDIVLSVARLIEMAHGGERFVKLGENDYLSLSDGIRNQLGRLASVAQPSRGKLVVPDLAMSVIADGVDDIVDIYDEETLSERKRLIREAAKLQIPIPDGLNAVLRPYQEEGFRWMMRLAHWNAGACLADDMGLGKTVQTIAFMLAHASDGPQLVVAPASVVGNWENELHRFAPGLKVVMVNAMGVSERKKAIADVGKGSVVVSTYGVLASEVKTFAQVDFSGAVLDEAHTIKNRDTKMSAAVMSLKARCRVILTGTPIQNHLGELWNLFRFINPGLLGSFEHFQETYVTGDCAQSRDALKRLVAPFMLRRTKAEVVRELPEKTEITIPVELSDGEMAVYELLRREARAELEQSSKLSVNALAMMTKLRMASCSASLVEPSYGGDSSKLDVFAQKLQDIVDGGNNVLVFSQFTSYLELARERCAAMGIKDYLYLDGSTPVAKRRKMVDEFQKGQVPVFFISLKAGGLGLNLTGANYVIHLDPWWNPAIEQQATDRAYRIGQKQNVTVYHLISSGTIEEKILRLHSTKQQLADAILSGTSASHKMTAEQILELLG